MTNLERRAMLGDRQAQEECTRRGIVLPCPLCAGEVAVNEIPPHNHKIATHMPDYAGGCFIECVCGYCVSGDDKQDALARHNTRPAPPIGRCGECAYWDKNTGECEAAADIEVAYHKYTEADFFCGDFEPREDNSNG